MFSMTGIVANTKVIANWNGTSIECVDEEFLAFLDYLADEYMGKYVGDVELVTIVTKGWRNNELQVFLLLNKAFDIVLSRSGKLPYPRVGNTSQIV